ncbi:MAG: hypothetical protein ACRDPK_18540 [Carbonactinosporaceae bacterium]
MTPTSHPVAARVEPRRRAVPPPSTDEITARYAPPRDLEQVCAADHYHREWLAMISDRDSQRNRADVAETQLARTYQAARRIRDDLTEAMTILRSTATPPPQVRTEVADPAARLLALKAGLDRLLGVDEARAA